MIEPLAESLQPVASWILFASLKSIVIIALVLLIRRLCARWLTPQGRYGLWFAVLACLSVPIGVPVRVGNELQPAAAAPFQLVAESAVASPELPIISIGDTPVATISALSTASKAILIWLLGVAGLATVVLHNASRYRRMKSQASCVDATTEELFVGCRQMLKIRRHVRLLETSQIESPVVVGYWWPTLLLPRNLAAHVSTGQLRLVLLHELTHVRRHDILVNWLVTVVQIAHWFNPLAWVALRVMRHDMEHACDASVLRHLSTSERIDYGDTLIRLSELTPRRTVLVQNASVIEFRSQLKARINMIAQFRSGGVVSCTVAAVLITLTSFVAVTQAASAPPQQPGTVSQAVPTAPARQGATTPAAGTPRQSRPTTETGRTAASAAPAAAKKAGGAPAPDSTFFQINYMKARDMASFIEAAPGAGLLSEAGSIAVDANTNTLLVRDTANNISAIRQLVARLDVPVQQVLVEAFVALVDHDLLQELTATVNPGGNWSPATVLGPGPAVIAALLAGQQAGRAEVISAPRVTTANRKQASISQRTAVPPQPGAAPVAPAKGYQLRVAFTPTVWPDRRMALDVDITMDNYGTMPNPAIMTAPANAMIPTIDTRQVKTQVVLDSGSTALLDVSEDRSHVANGAGAGTDRQLVVFVTPRLLADPAIPR